MITIEEAIEQSKNKNSITKHTSTRCFDFGEYVLLLYKRENKYGLAREDAESAMEGANRLADLGVNTPRYYAIKRVKDDDFNYCYILQDKAKGKQCNKICDYDEIVDIPQEHYDKLAFDLCALKEMGTESCNISNLFYDTKSGFWIIDLTPCIWYAKTITDEQALEGMIDFYVYNALFFKYPEDSEIGKQLAQIEETKRNQAIENYMNRKNRMR